MKLVLFNLSLILALTVNAQDTARKTFGVHELTIDVDYFFSALEGAHPNLYYYHSKDSVCRVKEEIKEQLVAPMSRDNFEKLMAYNTNHLFDGHTGLKWVFTDWETIPDSALLFPTSQISVIRGNMYLNEDTGAQKVLSINDKQVSELVTIMRRLIGDDQTPYSKDCRIEDYFSTYYYHLYGSSSVFNLTIEQQGKTTLVTLQGIAKSKALDYNIDDRAPFDLIIKNGIALLTVNAFDYEYFRDFKIFLEQSFKKIAQANVNYLFIDISENIGGASDNANLLLDYLYPVDYFFWDGYGTRRYSESYIESQRGSYFARYEDKDEAERRFDAWQSSIKQEYKTEGYEWERSHEIDSPYLGKLFILQSYKTFSAALDLSSAIKSSNRGLLIGEPTSDPAFNFTDQVGLRMPNTEIYIGCASTSYTMPSGSHNAKVGILPNILCHHKSLRTMKKDTNNLFNYFESIISKYGDWQNAIEMIKNFE